jgi:FkbM family methyltransferase
MIMRKKSFLLFVLGAVVVAAAGVYQSPRAKWRSELWISKIAGNLTDVTWGDLSAATIPRRVAVDLGLPALSVSPGLQGDGPCPVLWKTRSGSFWGASEDEPALRAAQKNVLVQEVYFRSPATVRPGDIVLDGGSHLGTFTRFALDRGARLVVAFEPGPISGAGFKKTFNREMEQGRVILIEEALWNQTGRLSFYDGGSSVNGKVRQSDDGTSGGSQKLEVSATTVDEAVRRLKLDRVDILKLHVEGAEKQALMGALNTLVRFKPRILVALDHHPDDPEVICRIILDAVPHYHIQMRGREQAFFYLN